MNAAGDGRIIADSEEPVRDANAVYRRCGYDQLSGVRQFGYDCASGPTESLCATLEST